MRLAGLFRAWVIASRPRTLPAAIVPVLVGSAVAASQGKFQPVLCVATLAVSLLLQIGANFANDVFDFMRGADAARRGPARVTQSGLLSTRQMLASTAIIFGAAALVGLYLVLAAGWPLLVAGALAMLSALAYTAGPFPLGYHGLGDLFVFIFFGLVGVAGTAFIQTGEVSPLALAAAVPVGLLITNILVVNNLRDLETDRRAGKRTLAVRIGERATRWQYVLSLVVAYLAPLLLWLSGQLGAWFWLAWLSLPLAVDLARQVLRTREAAVFNRLLARTAQLNLLFGMLFALSVLLR